MSTSSGSSQIQDQKANDSQGQLVANPTYQTLPYSPVGYRSFQDFYPYYLGEHRNAVCRRLHLVGTSITFGIQARILLSFLPGILGRYPHLVPSVLGKIENLRIQGGAKRIASLAAIGIIQGYAWAWIGHYFFENNKPATFKHPLWSFMGDLQMWKEVMLRRRQA